MDNSDVLALLKHRKANRSWSWLAGELKISQQLLNFTVTKQRPPSPKLLAALDLRRVEYPVRYEKIPTRRRKT